MKEESGIGKKVEFYSTSFEKPSESFECRQARIVFLFQQNY
jgi:hypothetical protein